MGTRSVRSVDLALWVALFGATGCWREVSVATGDADTHAVDASGFDLAADVFVWSNLPPQCESQAGTPVILTDEATIHAALLGQWWQCSGSRPLITVGSLNAAGVEFAADGTCYALMVDVDTHRLARAPGLDASGLWHLENCGLDGGIVNCVLECSISGNSLYGTLTFTTNPRKFGLNLDATFALASP